MVHATSPHEGLLFPPFSVAVAAGMIHAGNHYLESRAKTSRKFSANYLPQQKRARHSADL